MKQVIKVGLIIVVLAIIGLIIRGSLHSISEENSKSLASLTFENAINEEIDSVFKNNPDYYSAKRTYEKIMGLIKTEEFITLRIGQNSLPLDAAKNCKDKANSKFAPVFTNYATDYFSRSSWDGSELKTMQATAQSMLQSMGVTSDYAGQLKTIENNVTDYLAAKAIVANASKCTSVSGVSKIKSNAKAYLKAPLTNNTQLTAELNNAGETAKKSVLNYIIRLCNNANSLNSADKAMKLAVEYVQTFDEEPYALVEAFDYAKYIYNSYNNNYYYY